MRLRMARDLPHLFPVRPEAWQPFALGIQDRMAERLGITDPLERKALAHALASYTGARHYLASLKPGAHRLDIDGKPAGIVTEEEAARAAERLKAAKPHPKHDARATPGADKGKKPQKPRRAHEQAGKGQPPAQAAQTQPRAENTPARPAVIVKRRRTLTKPEGGRG